MHAVAHVLVGLVAALHNGGLAYWNSSNREHSHNTESVSASGLALPYLASSRGSSEPALSPIRIGTCAEPAVAAISLTLSSNFRKFPGLTRTVAQPASVAAKT